MALERRRLLVPLGIVILMTMLLLSFFRSNQDQSLWEVESLTPYEQEFELAGPLTPYIPKEDDIELAVEHNNNGVKVDSIKSNSEPIISPKFKSQISTNPKAIKISLATNSWPVPNPIPLNGRYLSYIAHSGFHNQRIAFVNALTLAQLLDRTLLVPQSTLGRAVDWVAAPLLQSHVEQAENTDIAECRKIKDKTARKEKCGIYWNSRRASWSWLLDSKALYGLQNLIDRPSYDKEWYWAALKIKNSDIKTFHDVDRHSHRFFESADMQDLLEGSNAEYRDRINIDELKASTDGYKLLEFGSLYGSSRLILKNTSKKIQLEKLMAFRQPILEKISEAVVERLGGRASFIGLHLRVGHGDKNDEDTIEKTITAFRRLVTEAYGLDSQAADNLLTTKSTVLESPTANSKTYYPTTHLACPSVLYDSKSPYYALNTPLYVATDSTLPSTDPLLEPFRNSFPCIFFLTDFRTINLKNQLILPELVDLENYIDETAEPLERFLVPFIDAEIAAKSKSIIGTPGSTFSTYVRTTLFESYKHQNDGVAKSNLLEIPKGHFGAEDTAGAEKVRVPVVVDTSVKETVKVPIVAAVSEEKEKIKPGEALELSLPDQIKEELGSVVEDKYLDENSIKEKMKAEKLAAEKVQVKDGTFPNELELEVEKASEGQFVDIIHPKEEVPTLEESIEHELEKVKEDKFLDGGVPVKEVHLTDKEKVVELKHEMMEAKESKYDDKKEVNKIKRRNRLILV